VAAGNPKCTFHTTGRNFHTQTWYYCMDCGLTGNAGMCEPCKDACHKGHNVQVVRTSGFYCDCGDRGMCNSLLPARVRPQCAAEAVLLCATLHLHFTALCCADGACRLARRGCPWHWCD
jgi:hypothetical protein